MAKVTQSALGLLVHGLPDLEAHVSFQLARQGLGREARTAGRSGEAGPSAWQLRSLHRSVFMGCGQMFLSVFEHLDMLRVTLLMARS